jgi:hypothetical protein
MAKLLYVLNVSLDGCIADEDGKLDWTAPDEEYFSGTVGPQRLTVSRTRLRSRVMGRFGSVWRATALLGPRITHHWEQTRWWGSEPLAISRASGSTPATRPGQFRKRLDPAGRVLVRITLGLVGPDELAARSLGGV